MFHALPAGWLVANISILKYGSDEPQSALMFSNALDSEALSLGKNSTGRARSVRA
jgi:hypothetical protein